MITRRGLFGILAEAFAGFGFLSAGKPNYVYYSSGTGLHWLRSAEYHGEWLKYKVAGDGVTVVADSLGNCWSEVTFDADAPFDKIIIQSSPSQTLEYSLWKNGQPLGGSFRSVV